MPVRIWHGDSDANVPVADGRRLAADLPAGDLTIVERAGHLMFVDHAAEILDSFRDDRAGQNPGPVS